MTTCREAAAQGGPVEAIAFLGVIGSREDLSRLLRVASRDKPTTVAVVEGVGRLGFPGGVPFLLEQLSHPELGACAGNALARILGDGLPQAAASPPDGLSDDDLDLWEPGPVVDAMRAREWWRVNSGRFDPDKRYQSGHDVSIEPLGPVFDQLPMSSRHDVYLRERALQRGAPDWELETWAWRQRDPKSSSLPIGTTPP